MMLPFFEVGVAAVICAACSSSARMLSVGTLLRLQPVSSICTARSVRPVVKSQRGDSAMCMNGIFFN